MSNPPLPSGTPAEELLAYEWRGWAVYPRNGETTPWVRGERRTGEEVEIAVVPCPPDAVVLVLPEHDAVTLSDMLRLVKSWTSSEFVLQDAERLLAKLRAASGGGDDGEAHGSVSLCPHCGSPAASCSLPECPRP